MCKVYYYPANNNPEQVLGMLNDFIGRLTVKLDDFCPSTAHRSSSVHCTCISRNLAGVAHCAPGRSVTHRSNCG